MYMESWTRICAFHQLPCTGPLPVGSRLQMPLVASPQSCHRARFSKTESLTGLPRGA